MVVLTSEGRGGAGSGEERKGVRNMDQPMFERKASEWLGWMSAKS